MLRDFVSKKTQDVTRKQNKTLAKEQDTEYNLDFFFAFDFKHKWKTLEQCKQETKIDIRQGHNSIPSTNSDTSWYERRQPCDETRKRQAQGSRIGIKVWKRKISTR